MAFLIYFLLLLYAGSKTNDSEEKFMKMAFESVLTDLAFVVLALTPGSLSLLLDIHAHTHTHTQCLDNVKYSAQLFQKRHVRESKKNRLIKTYVWIFY